MASSAAPHCCGCICCCCIVPGSRLVKSLREPHCHPLARDHEKAQGLLYYNKTDQCSAGVQRVLELLYYSSFTAPLQILHSSSTAPDCCWLLLLLLLLFAFVDFTSSSQCYSSLPSSTVGHVHENAHRYSTYKRTRGTAVIRQTFPYHTELDRGYRPQDDSRFHNPPHVYSEL